MIKECFKQEVQRVSDMVMACPHDMSFILLADSHLDDYEEETIENIQAVDDRVSYDFIVHLGDFMNGSFPKGQTARILKEEIAMYRNAVKSGIFYPVQGNHDGYCETDYVRRAQDIVVDEEWYEATAFTKEYGNVMREGKNPYFYADYEQKKLRLIFLCSFSYKWTEDKRYQKLYKVSIEQLEWLRREALAVDEDWTVMLFSHDGPLKLYDQDKIAQEPIGESARVLLKTVLDAWAECGFSIAGWFIGHWHGELCQVVEGIPFIIIGSQTSYVPQLWSMPEKGHYEKREIGTLSQDLWDSVAWDKAGRKLYLFRFGAGKDRCITY